MSVIEVIEPGLLTTVQDLGREGFAPLGVSPSGAADAIALRIGNRLVGNQEGTAGLELTLVGGAFAFPDGAWAALTGSDFGATLDGEPVQPWSSCEIRPKQALRLGATRDGARCYLCVRGGIAVKPFLGSASTHLLSGLGGHEGRSLRKGDVLNIGAASGSPNRRTVAKDALQRLAPRRVLRVTPGPQSDWFSEAAQQAFYGSAYRVAEQSNRMGLRLEGPPIAEGAPSKVLGHAYGEAFGDARGKTLSIARRKALGDLRGKALGEMTSEGVSLGAVQIASGGLPIILFVEQQTTGGYAKIANVISADLHSVGQLRPRDEVRFHRVDWRTARRLLMEQEVLLASENLIV